MLVGPNLNNPDPERELRDVQAAAHASGQELIVVEAGSDRDIETAFATFAQREAVALFIGSVAFFNSRRERVAAVAVRHALPAAYSLREFATAGGLMSYGTSRDGEQSGTVRPRVLAVLRLITSSYLVGA
jgi:putative ABC transport system substrate-binding protein